MVNLSKPDATTASAIKDVDIVKRQLPDVIVVMLGMTDITQRVSPNIIQANLDRIITSLKSLGAYIILVGIPAPKETGELYQYQVQMAYYNLAKGHAVPFYYSALAGIEGNPDYTLADGYHPNAQGVDVMTEGLFPFVDIGLRWRYDIYIYNQENQRNAQPVIVFPQP
jgi:acyl-CoA thioesterase-1